MFVETSIFYPADVFYKKGGNMSKPNFITAQDLLERKKIIDEKRSLVYHSECFGGDIAIKDDIDLLEITEIINQQDLNQTDKYARLIYMCCPLFKAPEFREVYEIKEPYDVVKQSFKGIGAELFELGNHILQAYGLMDADVVDAVKK